MAEQIRSHEVVRDHLIGHGVGSHPVVLSLRLHKNLHHSRLVTKVYGATMRSYPNYAMARRCVSYIRLVNKRILRRNGLSNKTFTCPRVTTGFISSSVPTREEEALTMPVGKMRDNYSAGN
ncbi:hypothetical protein ALC53_11114 [Atta colombica]|uniref:Uncharacterized protein n=1 Tax=Atta colombica TaxID=520822 RepID=A0A195B2M8_9HYME|nr:hypothetical protein ALC53_11114 [Atta colombica]